MDYTALIPVARELVSMIMEGVEGRSDRALALTALTALDGIARPTSGQTDRLVAAARGESPTADLDREIGGKILKRLMDKGDLSSEEQAALRNLTAAK